MKDTFYNKTDNLFLPRDRSVKKKETNRTVLTVVSTHSVVISEEVPSVRKFHLQEEDTPRGDARGGPRTSLWDSC